MKAGYQLPVNWNNSYFIANTDAYKKLSPDPQAKLMATAREAASWNQKTMRAEEDGSVKTLTDAGDTMVRATPADVTRASDVVKPYWEEWAKSRGPSVVEALAKVRAALGR